MKVRSGSTFEGIFKTLSSKVGPLPKICPPPPKKNPLLMLCPPPPKFELALDAVHRRPPEPPGGIPRREDIVDTMIFRRPDVVLVRFRNVDFAYATKGDDFGTAAGGSRCPKTLNF